MIPILFAGLWSLYAAIPTHWIFWTIPSEVVEGASV